MSLQTILDAVATLGALGMALLVVYGFITNRLFSRGAMDDKDKQISEQKADKKELQDLAKAALANNETLVDVVEAKDRDIADLKVELAVERRRGT